MEARTEKTLRITLKMTEKEARWLMENMQNPVLSDGEYEGHDCRNMRENFFTTLNHSLEE